MRIETITCVYNEEFLLPFYLKHYDFVDRFNILYDMKSDDKTIDILMECEKVKIFPINFPGGWNSLIKQLMIQDVYNTIIDDCWILNVDCDEFAFIKSLSNTNSSICRVDFYNVFRHVTEEDLDIKKSIKEQRCFGYLDSNYSKPILVKSGLDISWVPGNHLLTKPAISNSIIPTACIGAHWENADPSFCVNRRYKNRKQHISKYNTYQGYTIHNQYITEQQVIDYCKEHENDPKLW